MSCDSEETNLKGKIIIHEIWKEYHSKYQDEEITGAKLDVSKDGYILFTEYAKLLCYGPHNHGYNKKTSYKVPIDVLIQFIKEHGSIEKS